MQIKNYKIKLLIQTKIIDKIILKKVKNMLNHFKHLNRKKRQKKSIKLIHKVKKIHLIFLILTNQTKTKTILKKRIL